MRGTSTAAVWVAAAAFAFTSIGIAPTMASTSGTEPFGLDLEGEYRMVLGDDPAYAAPDFDDSGWAVTTVPTSDGHEGQYDDYDGFGWFRRSFTLPAEADGLNLVLSVGYLDDADEVFVNGVSVGKSGEFSPDRDSQWFERRLYPIPSDALVYGGENVIAVRLEDFSGGGGWYKGPVGIFSKERLREEVYGVVSTPAEPEEIAGVQTTLAEQASALQAGLTSIYLSFLDGDFFHDGDDIERRERDLARWLETYDSLILRDTEVEIVRTEDGRLLADSNRSLIGVRDGVETVIQPPTQEFLVFDDETFLEIGNRSRFFRDSLESELEGARREFSVYLPPSYLTHPDHQFPTVYMLHGINGGSREWEPREFDRLLDELFTTGGLAESIVIFPDGESLWYIDSSVTPWRSMFIQEMLPLVDAEYRTLPQREFRGLSGVSMGGHGAFTVGWSNPDLFSSIASHMGALNLPPLIGSASEMAANSGETPTVQVQRHDPFFLQSFSYFMDACRNDDFRFAEAAEAMSGSLTAKLAEHTLVIYPEGRHNDDCWLPHIDASFGLHSDSFRASGLEEPGPAPAPSEDDDDDDESDDDADDGSDDGEDEEAEVLGVVLEDSLPATGGGSVMLGLTAMAAAAALRTRTRAGARDGAASAQPTTDL